MPQDRIRVLCVDDHRLVRQGIATLISQQPDMEVVASAATGEEALVLFRQHRPDVTLMDLQLPGQSGRETIRAIKREHKDARIIVLTMYQGEEDIFRALEEGAATYLLKDSLFDDLANRIREVQSGIAELPPEIQARLEERRGHKPISARELQVVELIAQGRRNKEIAAELGITEETVQVHLRHLFTKLGVNDRTAVLTVAMRRGLIHLALPLALAITLAANGGPLQGQEGQPIADAFGEDIEVADSFQRGAQDSAAKTVGDGVYTDDQCKRGQEIANAT
jgi:DNA-binding NarL/FixJ family response regulator